MRSPRPCLWILLLFLGCAACAGGPEVVPDEDLSDLQLIEAARTQLLALDFDRVLEITDELLDRPLTPRFREEALYLEGEANFALEDYDDAWDAYRDLVNDHPHSDFIAVIEDHLYFIGEYHIRGEPSIVFKDLFTSRHFGAEVLRKYGTIYQFADRADDALEQLAAFHFSRREYDLAAERYETIAQNFPDSEWADFASYRVGLCWRLSSRGAGYDRIPLQQARTAFRRYLARTGGQYRLEAERQVAETEELLADGEWQIAHLYLLREQDRGARLHLANCVLAYPTTAAAGLARVELEARGWDLSINSVDSLLPATRPADGERDAGQ